MKKWSCILFMTLFAITVFGQDAGDDDASIDQSNWDNKGTFGFLFNQAAFNAEWTGGGTSSIAGNLSVDLDFKYKKDRTSWENKVILEYGLTKQNNDPFTRKTNDRIEINSVYGYEVTEDDDKAYYSFFINILTQATRGYTFSTDPDGTVRRTERTNLFSPGYFQAGPGFLYKKGKELTLNLAPSTARLITVDDRFTSGEDYVDNSYFGVAAGQSNRYELGASLNAFYKVDLLENITMENNLALYSNYLDRPGNVDINYLTKINLKVNDWISAKFIFQAIYDDNAVGAFQIREVSGLGVSYTL